jgi:hypothetical protein
MVDVRIQVASLLVADPVDGEPTQRLFTFHEPHPVDAVGVRGARHPVGGLQGEGDPVRRDPYHACRLIGATLGGEGDQHRRLLVGAAVAIVHGQPDHVGRYPVGDVEPQQKGIHAFARRRLPHLEMEMGALRASRVAAVADELPFPDGKCIRSQLEIHRPALLLVLDPLEMGLQLGHEVVHVRVEGGQSVGMVDINRPAEPTRLDLQPRHMAVRRRIEGKVLPLLGGHVQPHVKMVRAHLAEVGVQLRGDAQRITEVPLGEGLGAGFGLKEQQGQEKGR